MHSFLFTTPFVICVLGIFDPFEYAVIDTVRKLAIRLLAVIRIVEKCIMLIHITHLCPLAFNLYRSSHLICGPIRLVLCFINRLQIHCRKNVLLPIWHRIESCCIYINWQNVSGLVSVKLSRMGHLLTSNI